MAVLRTLMSRLSPARRVERSPGAPAQRIVLLEHARMPSTDYFVLPWARRRGVEVVRIDTRDDKPPPQGVLRAADQVVIVRYLPRPWRVVLEALSGSLAGLVYFMDDDLLDPAALTDLPRDYARKIQRLATSQRAWFEQHCSEFWVSTPMLAAKYAPLAAQLLPTRPPPELLQRVQALRYCYHGTSSHRGEIDWLFGVVRQVQGRCADAHFELFGDHRVNRLYRELPRVAIVHPMGWENYLAFTAGASRHIALAPLMPGAFNAGRGVVKFFDFVRIGAVGLYSDRPPFAGFIRHGVDGLLVGDDPQAWVDAIVALAGDSVARQRMAEAAAQRARVESTTP
ncbi:MAG: glycosyltransferase family 1 protein [Burkholderiaceae bacterium]